MAYTKPCLRPRQPHTLNPEVQTNKIIEKCFGGTPSTILLFRWRFSQKGMDK